MKILDTLFKIIKWCFTFALVAVLAAIFIRLLYFGYTKLSDRDTNANYKSTSAYQSLASSTDKVTSDYKSGKLFTFKLPPPGSWSLNLSNPNRPIDWKSHEPNFNNQVQGQSNSNLDGQWSSASNWRPQQQWPSSTYSNSNWKYDNVVDYNKPR